MKKFRFRLERVLQHREIVKEERRRELLLDRGALAEGETKLTELEEALLGNTITKDEMPESDLYLKGLYAARLKHAITNQKEVIEGLEKKVALSLEAYTEASKDAKALVTLKEKEKRQYDEVIAKGEEKFLDELVVQKGTDNKKNGG